MKNLEQFFSFVNERQAIWHKKTVRNLPRPWTEDVVLASMHFCNVYRAADPGTIYFNNNFSTDFGECYFQAVFYRMLNNRKVCEKLGGLPLLSNGGEYGEKLQNLAKNQPVFSKAFRTLCNIPEGAKRHDVLVGYIIEWCKGDYIQAMSKKLERAKSAEELFAMINGSWKFIGDFLAFQIMLDMLRHPFLRHLQEDQSWTLAGPGACAGLLALENIYNQEWEIYRSKKRRAEYGEKVAQAHARQRDYLPADFSLFENRWPNIHDIESCFCEYGKYMKLTNGKPCAKRIYKPSPH